MNTRLKAVILAAGKGTRLASESSNLPKVMRVVAGQPLIGHVMNALNFIPPADRIIVVGYMKEKVTEAFPECDFAIQEQQLGTGHAVMAAYSVLEDFDGDILICCGDMPLLKRESYSGLVELHRAEGNTCTILSGTTSLNLAFGRILRDEDGVFCGMVEEKDASEEQKRIIEMNSGVYVFNATALKSVLSDLKTDNSQGEYYLTDAPLLLLKKGAKVGICTRDLGYEIIGVNTPEQLAQAEEFLLK